MPFKTDNATTISIVRKITGKKENLELLKGHDKMACWFHDGPTYWIRALPFAPKGNKSNRSNHYHSLHGMSASHALILASILSSSTFYLYYKLVSNCRDLGAKEIYSFRIGRLKQNEFRKLAELGNILGERLKETAKRCSRNYPSGTIEYDEYYPGSVKNTIDEIDRVLARHYGFTDEELDFIINYDIKYRMGKDNSEEAE